MPLCTHDQVESVGALTFTLLQLVDQPTLDTFVDFAIAGADAWMQDKMGGNYNLTQFSWQVTQQQNGQIFLSLERISDTLKARKTYGTHSPYMSEDSPGFENLIMVNWGQRAMECLDRWVTVEQINRNFAMPIFQVGQPIPETDSTCNGLESLSAFYSGLLDRARSQSNPDLQTVSR